MKCADSGDIKILVRFPGDPILKFLFEVRNCVGGANMRGWFTPKITSCVNLFTAVIFVFTLSCAYLILRHAILTHIIFNFWSVLHLKPYFPSRPKIFLVFVKSLSEDIHLPQRPRKSFKVDVPFFVSMVFVRVRYHTKWFLKHYNLSFSNSSLIHWVQKFNLY